VNNIIITIKTPLQRLS